MCLREARATAAAQLAPLAMAPRAALAERPAMVAPEAVAPAGDRVALGRGKRTETVEESSDTQRGSLEESLVAADTVDGRVAAVRMADATAVEAVAPAAAGAMAACPRTVRGGSNGILHHRATESW
jgi:hypothetical protein